MEIKARANYFAILVIAIICLICSYEHCMVNASDPDALQDFCVGVKDPNSAVFVNGMFCKNPTNVTVQDFVYKGFNIPGNTNNPLKIKATLIDSEKFPALNTHGVSIAHIEFGPFGLNTPHHHPRSSEVFAVVEGTLYVGFITTEYELFDVILKPGDLFVFPQGLIHFQYNTKKSPAKAIAAFGSQRPGRVNSPQGLFGTNPPILDEVLEKAYQVDNDIVEVLRSQFSAGIKREKYGQVKKDA